jgi:hypothetical protein
MMRRCVLIKTVSNERPGRGKNRIPKECESPEAKNRAFAPRALEGPAVVGRLRINRPRRGSNETARSLRRNTVGESVRMKCGVITQTKPGTILFRSLRHTVFFARSKVLP